MITTNKTGTLNTKSVTASQLATNSPILPHKMRGQYYSGNGTNSETEGESGNEASGPPALPPRGVPAQRPAPPPRDGQPREGSLSRAGSLGPGGKGMPPAIPPKRSSLTRSELALYTESVSQSLM